MHVLRRAASTLKSPGFLVPCLLVFSIGFGAALAAFSLIERTLLRPLPGVIDSHRLVSFEFTTASGSVPISFRELQHLQRGLRSVESLFSYSAAPVNLGVKGSPPTLAACQLVTDGFFRGLGAAIAAGRAFSPEETSRAGDLAVVISHKLWQEAYSGKMDALGETVFINGRPAAIVGIAGPAFSGVSVLEEFDLWLPISQIAAATPHTQEFTPENRLFYSLYGRLAEDATPSKLVSELESFAAAFQEVRGGAPMRPLVNEDAGRPVFLSQYLQSILRPLSAVLLLIFVAAVANAGSLFLARGLSRRGDIAIRYVLGASRPRLYADAVLETLFVAVLGSLAAVLLAAAVFAFFDRMGLLSAVPGYDRFTLSSLAVFFVFAAATFCALFTGIASAWSGTTGLGQGLKESHYSLARPARLRSLLASVQIGVTFALLVAAGGFAITLQHVLAINLGIDLPGLYSFSIQPELNGYDEERTRRLYRQVLAGVRNRTEVSGAALVQLAPFDASRRPIRLRPKQSSETADWVTALRNRATSEYFRQLGVPFLEGRDFSIDLTESNQGQPIAVVSRALAETFWPSGAAVGRILEMEGGGEFVVTGVVEDHRVASPFRTHPLLYEPLGQSFLPGRLSVVFRGPIGAGEAGRLSREEVGRHDANLAVFRAAELERRFEGQLSDRRLLSYLSALLAIAAVSLCSAGLYGALSWNFQQRSREYGIRLALGAGKRQIAALPLRHTLYLTAGGLAIGTVLTWLGSEWIAARLYQGSVFDLRAVGLAALIILVCALGASLGPIRRTLTVNPSVMLRAL